MAAFRLFVTGAGATANNIVPTTNTTFYTPELTPLQSNQYDNWQFYIEFFSDAEGTTPVAPSAGTISVAATPMGANYLTASNTQVIQATTCGTPDSSYTPPAAEGQFTKGRIVLAGVTGAPYFRAQFRLY